MWCGVVDDLLERMAAVGSLNAPQDGMQGRIRVPSYNISCLKCAADHMLVVASVRILFHAWAAAVLLTAMHIDALVVETKSGRVAIRSARFIDCSEDANVANFAGVAFKVGSGVAAACARPPCFVSGMWTPPRHWPQSVTSRQSTR